MEIRKNIAGIPIKDLKILALKYIGNDDLESQQQIAIKINIAKCARLSYNNHDGEIDYEKDIQLHDRLLDSKHMSPFEHCAKAMNDEEYNYFTKTVMDKNKGMIVHRGWCNNFKGFIPYRYLIENEN